MVGGETHIADVVGDLAASDEEGDGGHPFVCAETGLAGKVVEVGDEAGHEVGQAGVGGLRVDADGVGGDVVDGEIQEGGDVEVCWGGHLDGL